MLTEERKKERIGRITSSVSAGCLGVDEDKSEIDSWLEITGRDRPEMAPEQLKACERGNRLEAIALDYAAEKRGLVQLPAPFRVHHEHDWLGDSADCMYMKQNGTEGNGSWPVYEDPIYMGEAKTVAQGRAHLYGKEGTDQVPMKTLVQSHHHLLHWPEARSCLVPVLVGGFEFEFRLYEVQRDEEMLKILVDKLGEWHHEYVVGDKAPPASHLDGGYFSRLYSSRQKLKPLPDDPAVKRWAIAKAEAAAKKKAAAETEEHAKNQLRRLLGDHQICEGPWGKATWAYASDRDVIDHEAIAQELLDKLSPGHAEEIIARHTSEKKGGRSLRVSLAKAIRKDLGL